MKKKIMNYGNNKLIIDKKVLRKGDSEVFKQLSKDDLEKAKRDSNNCIIVTDVNNKSKMTQKEGDRK